MRTSRDENGSSWITPPSLTSPAFPIPHWPARAISHFNRTPTSGRGSSASKAYLASFPCLAFDAIEFGLRRRNRPAQLVRPNRTRLIDHAMAAHVLAVLKGGHQVLGIDGQRHRQGLVS